MLWLTLSGSNYSCLKQITIVQKMLEPLKLDCIYYKHETERKPYQKHVCVQYK